MNEILNEQLIYQGKICKLTHDEVTFENGKKGYRDVLHLSGAVVILAIDNEGRILFVSQYRHAVERQLLELPAGMLEKDEDPLDAARRELHEETGYWCGSIRHLTSFYSSPGVVKETLHLYLAEDLTMDHQDLDPDEFIKVQALYPAEVEKILAESDCVDGKTLLGYLFWKNMEKAR